jgi:hypothetical protein
MMVDHIIPQVAGGSDDFDNLCLACPTCNGAKHNFQTGTDPETGEDVPLYHPRNDDWTSHFAWSEDFTEIIGLSPVGRATVLRLNMNLQEVVEARRRWVSVGWHPPSD